MTRHYVIAHRIVCVLAVALMYMTAPFAQECVAPPADLVAWWPGDGNTDERVAGRDGQSFGGLEYDDGMVDEAFSFDGIAAGVEIPNTDGVFDLVGPWTIDAWVYPLQNGRDARRDPIVWKIGRPDSNSDTFAIGWGCRTCADRSSFQASFERASDGRDFVVSSAAHEPMEWHHVTAVYDGTNLLIYVDGVEEGRLLTGPVVPRIGSAPLRIGNTLHTTHVPSGVFDGLIDEVEIFDRALTVDEIGALYEAGPAGKCKTDDADGDGFAVPQDCNDTVATINPGAPELPGNRIDENCDGELACDPCDDWRNHGKYVSCVSRTAGQLVDEGRISSESARELITTAARSDIGKKLFDTRECPTEVSRTQLGIPSRRGGRRP